VKLFSKRYLASFLNRRLQPYDVFVTRRSELWHPTAYLGRQPELGADPRPVNPPLLHWCGSADRGVPFDFAIVMPSLLRPTIVDALQSIFAQDFRGTVQTLIGVDRPLGDWASVASACRECPPNHSVLLLDPGYSTSTRHGGLHPAQDGGVLRTVLSYLAASRRIAYLDDDNWWDPRHLSTLYAALEGHDWAWSLRWYVHPRSRRVVCEDIWESVGPDAGTQTGGWVDPNCLAVDKLACEALLRWWSIPNRNSRRGTDADRNVFRILSGEFRGRCTGQRTAYYALNEKDPDNDRRLDRIGKERYRVAGMG
jgi:hypothetical protein